MEMSENPIRFFFKRYWLKLLGYANPHRYWNHHWLLSPRASELSLGNDGKLVDSARSIMEEYDCHNILDIGCGRAYCRMLPGYLGLDWSLQALKKSELPEFLYADFADHIPLPDKSFDAAFVSAVLIHVPDWQIERAVSEISRVVKKVIILNEPPYGITTERKSHVFNHDLVSLFSKRFDGYLVFLNENLWVKGNLAVKCP